LQLRLCEGEKRLGEKPPVATRNLSTAIAALGAK